MAGAQVKQRVDWVDTAKGICIVFVVMMHSVLGVEAAAGQTGWMHAIVAFAKPFRMPDFFMISGLFLSTVIQRDWRLYLDRKVVHFAYFYVLWVTIQFALKAPSFAEDFGWNGVLQEYLWSFIQPFGTLWFIYLLPIFFVTAKLLHTSRTPHWAVLLVAALLQIAPIETGSMIIDEFAERFVFFYAGYVFAPQIFRFAAWARQRMALSLGLFALWALVNGSFVFAGLSDLPVLSLALGAIGAVAVILASTLLQQAWSGNFFRSLGQHSLVVYLAFFLPMAVSRVILLKLGILDIGTISVLVTAAGVICPMILYWLVSRTGYGWFLFRRPGWARLDTRPAQSPAATQAASLGE
ncbi:acyltransferase family protein [Labrenzia suaedae]|uniref:Acyltransferase family protein n=2 Tax=Roseibium litorale TaxID=2803841 RepID=A0ABR9CMI6_9HYPH|nr:acyltransferase family protein [Roseibium litorale]